MKSFVLVFCCLVLLAGCGEEIRHDLPVSKATVAETELLFGLEYTDEERGLGLEDVKEQREAIAALRALELPNEVRPAVVFRTYPADWIPGMADGEPSWSEAPRLDRPDDLGSLAYATVGELSSLLERRLVTSEELTRMFLDRLREHGPELECVVTLTEDIALEQARSADREIAAGRRRGPLHGVPYGVKDLLAVAGTRTTWGAAPYRNQVIDDTATVVERLEAAGAVLCAKLTLGALAWGDVWYGGVTRNPWNLEEGSSGSSAGPASAVSAGLVPFAIGTETWGSIVSPSTRCGVTGLRPTFGRVSRAGAMALSWTMDKIGPMARTVEDCALVFDAIRGYDRRDPSVVDLPFAYDADQDWSSLRIGYVQADFDVEREDKALDDAALDVLRRLCAERGAELVPVALPERDPYPLSIILSVEAAAAFEQLTLSGRDDELVSQIRYAWPNVFRTAQLVPATAYVQANRARSLLIEEMAELFEDVDLYVCPSFVGKTLLTTNLTGHPCVVVPNGFEDEDSPHSWTFIGDLFDEATLMAVAKGWQDATEWHQVHPPRY